MINNKPRRAHHSAAGLSVSNEDRSFELTKKTLLHPDIIRQLVAYDPDTGKMTWKPRQVEDFKRPRDFITWTVRFCHMPAFTMINAYGYCVSPIWGVRDYKGQAVAWAIMYGKWPVSQLDHINGDRSDNRITNLREVSHAENCKNRALPRCNKSGAQGVQHRKESGRYRAYINSDAKKRIWLGTYDTFEEALAVRKDAELRFGYHENHGRVPQKEKYKWQTVNHRKQSSKS